MMYLGLALTLFLAFGFVSPADREHNRNLALVCNDLIFDFTSRAQLEYKLSAATPLFRRSTWVHSSMKRMNDNMIRFLELVRKVMRYYYKVRVQETAKIVIQASSVMAEVIQYSRNMASATKVKNIRAITVEANELLYFLKVQKRDMQAYVRYRGKFTLLPIIAGNDEIWVLDNVIYRTALLHKDVMVAVSTRVQFDPSFPFLAFSLDYRRARGAKNVAAMKLAIQYQREEFEVRVNSSTTNNIRALNETKAQLEDQVVNVIEELNTLTDYTSDATDTAISQIITQLVPADVVANVYDPLSKNVLAGVSGTYLPIYYEFLEALVDCLHVVIGNEPGANGSDSSNESDASYRSDRPLTPYSMKGEVGKCRKRGRGLELRIQEQFGKGAIVPICGASSIYTIVGRVAVAQREVNTCASKLNRYFNIVLDDVKAVIRSSVDAIVKNMVLCAQKYETELESTSCTDETIDPFFVDTKSDCLDLVGQLKEGGTHYTAVENCRLETRSAFRTELFHIKASFRTCSGIAPF